MHGPALKLNTSTETSSIKATIKEDRISYSKPRIFFYCLFKILPLFSFVAFIWDMRSCSAEANHFFKQHKWKRLRYKLGSFILLGAVTLLYNSACAILLVNHFLPHALPLFDMLSAIEQITHLPKNWNLVASLAAVVVVHAIFQVIIHAGSGYKPWLKTQTSTHPIGQEIKQQGLMGSAYEPNGAITVKYETNERQKQQTQTTTNQLQNAN